MEFLSSIFKRNQIIEGSLIEDGPFSIGTQVTWCHDANILTGTIQWIPAKGSGQYDRKLIGVEFNQDVTGLGGIFPKRQLFSGPTNKCCLVKYAQLTINNPNNNSDETKSGVSRDENKPDENSTASADYGKCKLKH